MYRKNTRNHYRVVRSRNAGFTDLILADLKKQGYKGISLSIRLREEKSKVRQAVERMISEADELAQSEQSGPSLDDLFA